MRKILTILLTTAIVIAPMQAAEAKTPFAVSAAPSATALTYGGAVTVAGAVSPKAKYKKVYVQVLTGGKWVNVVSKKLSKKSKYAIAFVPRLGPQVYRVFKGSSKKKAPGASTPFWITTSRWINLDSLVTFTPGTVIMSTAVIKGHAYPNSLSLRSVDGASGLADADLTGRGCTQLDTHLGVRSIEASDVEGQAYVFRTIPGIHYYEFETDFNDGQNARHSRVSIADATVLHLLGQTHDTDSFGTTYMTFASPMVYCAS